MDLLNRFSLKSVLISMAASFMLATALSAMLVSALLPSSSASKKSSKSRASVNFSLPNKYIEEDQIKKILDRNLFNHEGTLGDQVESDTSSSETSQDKLVPSSLPLIVQGIIFSGDPLTGLAMIKNKNKSSIKSYVVGDEVLNRAKVAKIYESRVILEKDGRFEYIDIEKFELKRRRGGAKRKKSSGPSLTRIATSPPPKAYKETGFERDGMEIKLTDEYKRNLLQGSNMTKVLQDAKARPNMVNGVLKGFELTRIREDSIYEKAGFQNGDIVEEINGIPLKDAASSIRLLQQLKAKNVNDIEVRLNRGGSIMDMVISIQ